MTGTLTAGDGMPDTGPVTSEAGGGRSRTEVTPSTATPPHSEIGSDLGQPVTDTADVPRLGRDADDDASPDAAAVHPGFDDDDTADAPHDRDWAWVEEWRASGESPAWAPGLTLAGFIALVVGLAVYVLSTGLADIPWLAVSANVLVAAGLAPALWLSRHLPVLRWISGGAAVGVVLGWIAALIG
jgi:hypothetical protein